MYFMYSGDILYNDFFVTPTSLTFTYKGWTFSENDVPSMNFVTNTYATIDELNQKVNQSMISNNYNEFNDTSYEGERIVLTQNTTKKMIDNNAQLKSQMVPTTYNNYDNFMNDSHYPSCAFMMARINELKTTIQALTERIAALENK